MIGDTPVDNILVIAIHIGTVTYQGDSVISLMDRKIRAYPQMGWSYLENVWGDPYPRGQTHLLVMSDAHSSYVILVAYSRYVYRYTYVCVYVWYRCIYIYMYLYIHIYIYIYL